MAPEDIEWLARRYDTPEAVRLRDVRPDDFNPGIVRDINEAVARNEAGWAFVEEQSRKAFRPEERGKAFRPEERGKAFRDSLMDWIE